MEYKYLFQGVEPLKSPLSILYNTPFERTNEANNVDDGGWGEGERGKAI